MENAPLTTAAASESAGSFVERLKQVDTCAVSDALDRLQRPGVVLGLRAVGPRRRIAGRVVTVTLEPNTPGVQARLAARAEKPRHLGTAAVDAAGPDDVIVVSHGGRLEVSGWGGILSLAARTRGVEGVLVDGACRDADDALDLDFPVYARATVPLTARGRVVETDWNTPITFGGVAVEPGDYVIADQSGVVFIRAAEAEEVLAVAEEVWAKEAAMAEAVRAGQPVSQVMGGTYEHLLRRKDPSA